MADAQKYFPTPLQQYQYLDKYAKWIPDLKRRECWPETVDRVIGFLKTNAQTTFTTQEWSDMKDAMQNLSVFPSMRLVQMAGPALSRCNVGLYNCAYTPLDSIQSFSELLYILMQGTGCSFSVEDRYISRLPRVRKQKRGLSPQNHIVPDTTEGWCDALAIGLLAWFTGKDVRFDYSRIRCAGDRLKTKGGIASGPQALKDLLNFARSTLLAAQGRKLTPLECHDMACYIGYVVQVGGVRRSAELSLSDLDDHALAECKNGEFWGRYPYRAMANNSAVYEEKPSAVDFMEEWLNLAKSGTGERGIFNRECVIPERRKRAEFGTNPCGEIMLRPRGLCNLSICVARPNDTLETLANKVRIATMFGTAQCTFTYFPYLSAEWSRNAAEERLLGVDITGQRDCELLQNGNRQEIFAELKSIAIAVNKDLAERFGINQSVAVTCVKPSGNSSTLIDCASGIRPRHSPYYIRRVRTGARTAMGRMLKDVGVPYQPETGQTEQSATILVFEFPVKAPPRAICRKDVTAAEQFHYWLDNRLYYTEHSASCTIDVEDDEWLSLGCLVYEKWDCLTGLSFLPKTNHIYPLAPYEEISEQEYQQRLASFPDIDYSKLSEYETEDTTERALDFACTSGQCII